MTAYLNFLKNPGLDRSKGAPAARRLYKELIEPVEGFVSSSVTNLIIVPDGILYKLPFETLIRQDANTGKESLLVERFDVSYAPSASALAQIMGKAPGRPYDKDLLAFGAPLYPKSDGQRISTSDLRAGFFGNPTERRGIPSILSRTAPEKSKTFPGLSPRKRESFTWAEGPTSGTSSH